MLCFTTGHLEQCELSSTEQRVQTKHLHLSGVASHSDLLVLLLQSLYSIYDADWTMDMNSGK